MKYSRELGCLGNWQPCNLFISTDHAGNLILRPIQKVSFDLET